METRQLEIMRREGNLPKTAARLRIAETFTSLQGEGRLTGTRSFFIRTSGCNLRCWFCDTPYASWQPEGDWSTIDRLVAGAIQSGCRHVVVTGGEPMLPMGIVELVNRLRAESMHVTIETAGTVFRDVPADLMSISPKLAGSGPRSAENGPRGEANGDSLAARHEATRWRPDVIGQLTRIAADFQIKYVVDRREDFDAAIAATKEIGAASDSVWIMPQGIDAATLDEKAEWLRPLCAAHGFHFCDRMHVRWYGNRRGT